MEWIKVKDKLPEPTKKVWLGSVKRQQVIMGYYEDSLRSFFDLSGNGVGCSHWMEIEKPEPPKQ